MRSSPLQLLLIEDNAAAVLLLKDALQDAACTSVVVTHVEALERARQVLLNSRSDAAILDLGLPDGRGLYTYVRFQQYAPTLPVVVLIGLMNDAVVRAALQHGCRITSRRERSGDLSFSERFIMPSSARRGTRVARK